nr:rhodanese-like domain-containing protein [Sulfurovaceae bacterium]
LNIMAYDTVKINELNKFYSHMTQKACAESKLFVKAQDTMQMIRDNNVTLLDVRTEGEVSIIALSGKNSIHIPIKDLFQKDNLVKIPTKKPIVIVCYSGTRAVLSAIGLKQIGFKDIHVLKGGIVELSKANNTKNAPLK